MNVGDKLRKIRLIRNMKLAEVGELVGKAEATIQRYESGDIVNLKLDVVAKLAEVYKVSPAYIMGWESETITTFSHEYNYFPVPISAGLLENIDFITKENVDKIILPDNLMGKWAGSNEIVMMRVNGDSMNKIIPHDTLIAIKQIELSCLSDNDIVVFSNENDYSVKRFYNDKENRRFIFRPDSTDSRFTDYIVSYDDTDNLKLHGRVVVYVVVND